MLSALFKLFLKEIVLHGLMLIILFIHFQNVLPRERPVAVTGVQFLAVER